jgi:hypothetical protein
MVHWTVLEISQKIPCTTFMLQDFVRDLLRQKTRRTKLLISGKPITQKIFPGSRVRGSVRPKSVGGGAEKYRHSSHHQPNPKLKHAPTPESGPEVDDAGRIVRECAHELSGHENLIFRSAFPPSCVLTDLEKKRKVRKKSEVWGDTFVFLGEGGEEVARSAR